MVFVPFRKDGLTYNVMDYGAHRDPTNFDAWATANEPSESANPYDDTTHIQAAVNAAYTAGGGRVYLPGTRYSLKWYDTSWFGPGIHGQANAANSGHIDLLDNVTVYGDGPGNTIVLSTYPSLSPFIASGRTSVRLQDMTIYSVGDDWSDGFKLINCISPRMRNLEIYGLYIGGAFYNVINGRIENCIAHDSSGSNGAGFVVGSISSAGFPFAQVSSRNIVSDCEAYGMTLDGFLSQGSNSVPVPNNDTQFIRCNAHDNDRWGFSFRYGSNVKMLDCIAEDSGYMNTMCVGLINNANGATADYFGYVTAAGLGYTLHNTTYGGTGGSAIQIVTAEDPAWGIPWLYAIGGPSSGVVED